MKQLFVSLLLSTCSVCWAGKDATSAPVSIGSGFARGSIVGALRSTANDSISCRVGEGNQVSCVANADSLSASCTADNEHLAAAVRGISHEAHLRFEFNVTTCTRIEVTTGSEYLSREPGSASGSPVTFGPDRASGALQAVHDSSSIREAIGCRLEATTSSRRAFCYANDTSGSFRGCFTEDQFMFANARALNASAELEFRWGAPLQCTAIITRLSSSLHRPL